MQHTSYSKMTSTETPRTSGIDTKLEGRHNYHSWFQQLRLELRATDPLYWPAIMGVNEGPVEPKYQCYTREQAISAIAISKQIAPLQVTNQEGQRFFDEVIEQNKLLSHKYDAELEEWEKIIYRLRLKFGSTLDKSQLPISSISMVLDLHFWLSKASMVGFTIQLMHLEWQNWMIIPHKGGVQTEMFLFCFKEEMEEISKDQFYRRSSRRVIPTVKTIQKSSSSYTT
jgi:hypothetical protein